MYTAHRLCACLTAAALALALTAGCGSDNSNDSDNPGTPPDDQDAAAQAETSLPSEDAAPDVEQVDAAALDAVEEPVAQQDAAEEAAAVAKCKNEVDLSTQPLPCDCYGTIVNDVKEAMPDCALTVVCCPGVQGLKCE